MEQLKIKLNGKEYIIKQTFRTYLLFEERTGKQISDIKSIKDILELLYCSFKGCNKDFEYDFDQFIDFIDEDPTILTRFNEFNESLTNTISNPTEKKRKVKD